MDDNQRAELARQESARQDAKLQMENGLRTQEQVKLQMETVLRKHERYCPSCSGPTTTGGECVNCMKIRELNDRTTSVPSVSMFGGYLDVPQGGQLDLAWQQQQDDLTRQQEQQDDLIRQQQAQRVYELEENVLRRHERYCPSCSGPTTTGGECVNCMKIDELIRQQDDLVRQQQVEPIEQNLAFPDPVEAIPLEQTTEPETSPPPPDASVPTLADQDDTWFDETFSGDTNPEADRIDQQRRDEEDDFSRQNALDAELHQQQQQWQEHSGAIARDRQDFMQKTLAQILADPENHPLRKLVNPQTNNWWARSHLSELPGVQAGHLTSRHSGAPERFALEDPFYNQVSNWRGETQGAIFNKPAVDIGGVPVERRTAEEWRRQGLIT